MMSPKELTKSRTLWRARRTRARRIWLRRRKQALELERQVVHRPHNEELKKEYEKAQAGRVYWYRAFKTADKMVAKRTRQLRLAPQEMSKKGLEMLLRSEGFVPYAYLDSRGLPTFGVGHLISTTPGLTDEIRRTWGTKANPKSRAFVMEVLMKDLDKFEDAVRRGTKTRPWQFRFDAFVHIAFNIGTSGFLNSTFLRLHNAGDKLGAGRAIMLWNKPKEIIGRRLREQRLYLTGKYE